MLTAVAAAFADSSIVVLAVPELLGEFDLGVTSASWVITAYNVAVVVTGAALIPAVSRIRTARLAGIGFAAFALASAGCAAATSFGLLVGFRAAQGAAAGLVLVAALPLLGGRPGGRAWTLAATIGLAAGPALGGFLTELFSWRSIFVAQAPLVALGLLALRGDTVVADEPATETRKGFRRANAALAALSAAGLVLALVVVTPVLVSSLTQLERDAETVGGELVFRADLPLATKVPVLVDLAVAAEAVDARLPDFEGILAPWTSRAALLRALTGGTDSPWTDVELTLALRAGIVAAIETERELGTISAEMAALLRVLAATAPLDWLRDALRGGGG